jgi:hypothetical protein
MSAHSPNYEGVSDFDFDFEHETRPDDSVAVNEAPARGATDEETTVELERPVAARDHSEQRARQRYEYMMARRLLSALSTGALETVSGAASLRLRRARPPAPIGPRSLLSHAGAPQRIVSVSALRTILRRKRRG